MDRISLSIITINYNNADGLKRTIQSVVNQSFKNFEYVVIDGMSTDCSKQLLEKYDNNIDYWVSEKDKGIYHAMNKGIKAAKGKYLLFLNSGDFLVNDKMIIDKIIKNIYNYDIIAFNANILLNEKVVNVRKHPSKISLSYVYENGFKHQSTIIKRNLFDKMGLYDETFIIAGDYEFWIRCFTKRNIKYKGIDFIITNFMLGGVSQSISWKKEHELIENKHLTNYLKDLKELKELRFLRKFSFLIPIMKKINRTFK